MPEQARLIPSVASGQVTVEEVEDVDSHDGTREDQLDGEEGEIATRHPNEGDDQGELSHSHCVGCVELTKSLPFATGPDVIPLQYLGACNTDLSSVTTDELMQYALANLDQTDEEGGYAVRHGSKPMNSFGRPRAGATDDERRKVLANNPMSSAFPTLFPYDKGGIETERPRPVSFTEHVRWALQYYDRRF